MSERTESLLTVVVYTIIALSYLGLAMTLATGGV